ncbi:MAG: hypothetical protein DMG34_05070 [Acidobacteria bacterium]|nr:MAG: hypothetical protein DMG34_05070 [Acidobacteriota bacterium]
MRSEPRQVRSWPAPQKLLISWKFDSGIGFAVESCHGGLQQVTQEEGRGPAPQPRGRPSTVAQYTPQVTQWLHENPNVSAAEILRRVRRAGYRGGKSALYELVKRLRVRRLQK